MGEAMTDDARELLAEVAFSAELIADTIVALEKFVPLTDGKEPKAATMLRSWRTRATAVVTNDFRNTHSPAGEAAPDVPNLAAGLGDDRHRRLLEAICGVARARAEVARTADDAGEPFADAFADLLEHSKTLAEIVAGCMNDHGDPLRHLAPTVDIDAACAGHPEALRQLAALRALERYVRFIVGGDRSRTCGADLLAELNAADAAASGKV